MIRYIKTKRSTQETIYDKMIPDNWWSVYANEARMEGRRIRYYDNSSKMEIIYTEKDYTITLIREGKNEHD